MPFRQSTNSLFQFGAAIPELESKTKYIVEDCGLLIQIAVENHPVLQSSNGIGILGILGKLCAILSAKQCKSSKVSINFVTTFVIQVARQGSNRRILKQFLERKIDAVLLCLREDL